MVCPNCSARCLIEDGYCHTCNRPLPSGLRQATVVSWSCGIGALLGALFVFLIAPMENGSQLGAVACAAIPFAFGGACVAGLMGWLIGRVACEH